MSQEHQPLSPAPEAALQVAGTLPAPARYVPLEKGRYDVSPSLKPLGFDWGNGDRDAQAFQLDCLFGRYRRNKLECRAGRPGKHMAASDYRPAVAAAVARFFLDRLTVEHPGLFAVDHVPPGTSLLHCRLTGETLELDSGLRLRSVRNGRVEYEDAFDALCCQVQEDVAVVSTDPERGDWLSALHVCAPSHWIPEEKIGRDFRVVHAPVPGMEAVNRASAPLVDAMVRRGPWVRFVWGIATDDRLNRHPEPPAGSTPEEWRSPPFDPTREPPFWLRVERQVIWGLPEVGASVFLIRPYLLDGGELCSDSRTRSLLRAGLVSMCPESRVYKGVAEWGDALIAWLAESPADPVP